MSNLLRLGLPSLPSLPSLPALQLPTTTSIPGLRLLDRSLQGLPRPMKPLATPPAGSALLPVPGDDGPPLIGYSLAMLLGQTRLAMSKMEEYGPVAWGRVLGQPMVFAGGPDATQTVLANKDKAYSQDGWNFFIGSFFPRGLMLLSFGEHHLHRRVMQEAFTRDRLATYLKGLDPLVTEGVRAWGRDGEVLAYDAMKQMSLDVASVIFMGEHPDDTTAMTKAFLDLVHAGTSLIRYPVPGGSWARGLAARRMLEDHFRTALPAKRASSGDDFFSALCHARTDDGEMFTDDDVVNHMIFLIMAAHDTATITTSATLYQLAKHPEWQQRARAESLALGDGPLTLDGLDTLTTLELVINESMRLMAPVPGLIRKTVVDTDLLGHYVPAGTLVGVLPGVNHLLPEYWTNPHRFDPTRFAEPRREDKSHRFAFLPFGGGAHKCIGMAFGVMEVKSVLHRLLLDYDLSLRPGYKPRWDHSSLPKAADGMPIRLTPRR